MTEQIEYRICKKRGFHLITNEILKQLPPLPEKGLFNLYIHHTSAGITINENADPSVRYDFENFLNKLIPDGFPQFTHTLEGDDDMSAHIKSSIIGTSISIPIYNHKLKLGEWQGIYLCEFRNNATPRLLTATIIS